MTIVRRASSGCTVLVLGLALAAGCDSAPGATGQVSEPLDGCCGNVGTICGQKLDCCSGNCVSGLCAPSPIGGFCAFDDDCQSGNCDTSVSGGQCVGSLDYGAVCKQDLECTSRDCYKTTAFAQYGHCGPGVAVFNANGSDTAQVFSFSDIQGCDSVYISAWGAGGGEGSGDASSAPFFGYGSFVSGVLQGNLGSTINMWIGQAGADASNRSSLSRSGAGWSGTSASTQGVPVNGGAGAVSGSGLRAGGGGGLTTIASGDVLIYVAGGGGGGSSDCPLPRTSQNGAGGDVSGRSGGAAGQAGADGVSSPTCGGGGGGAGAPGGAGGNGGGGFGGVSSANVGGLTIEPEHPFGAGSDWALCNSLYKCSGCAPQQDGCVVLRCVGPS
jgi:hypothetical protein